MQLIIRILRVVIYCYTKQVIPVPTDFPNQPVIHLSIIIEFYCYCPHLLIESHLIHHLHEVLFLLQHGKVVERNPYFVLLALWDIRLYLIPDLIKAKVVIDQYIVRALLHHSGHLMLWLDPFLRLGGHLIIIILSEDLLLPHSLLIPINVILVLHLLFKLFKI